MALEALALMPSRMLGSIRLGSLRRDRRPAALRRARGPRSEALRLAQAVALKASKALEALALLLRSTMGVFSMAHGAGALLSRAQDCQAQDNLFTKAEFNAKIVASSLLSQFWTRKPRHCQFHVQSGRLDHRGRVRLEGVGLITDWVESQVRGRSWTA